MAIIDTPLVPPYSVWGHHKSMERSVWKGRPTVQRTRRPADRKSPAQIAVRAIPRFCGQQWETLDNVEQFSWRYLSIPAAINEALAFIWSNQIDFFNGLTPERDHNEPHDSTPIPISSHTYTGQRGSAALALTPASTTDLWGFQLLRSPQEIVTPTWQQTILLLPANPNQPTIYVDSPVPPGTWHYRCRSFNIDQIAGPWLADESVTVT